MERDPRIENIGKQLCSICKIKIENYYKKNPTPSMMALYVLRVCCPACKRHILSGAMKVRQP